MFSVELIGVLFDGYGREGHQAGAAEALREAGLIASLAGHQLVESHGLTLPASTPDRGPETSLINEPALLAMTEQVGDRVATAVAAGRFPLVYGADCTTLLGTIPALHREQPVGLLFVDGHEDTMPLDVSEDGEAANSEIGLLLGLTGRLLCGRLAERLPALERDELAMLGPRDAAWRKQFNVGSLRDVGVWMRDWREVAAEPETAGARAVTYLQQGPRRWWLHVDLDVLDPDVFSAQGLPDVDDEPDGLTWHQLTAAVCAAVARGGCLGMSVAIYDPDQDPDRSDAPRILRFLSDAIAAVPAAMSR
ncbi:arginase [Brevibacterium sandarakinum]|uniref:Arginase n=1 Tax=Brevibacterium sandarakinum TaxID=629680 RepID=A0A1H1XCT6_BRESA|nr:arginase family protein [Brevibacterium sandarakinum]SDT07087.1 arginase [Brevibacterium sandarakinum]